MTRGHLILEHSIDQLKRGSQYRRDLDDDLDELSERMGEMLARENVGKMWANEVSRAA